MPAIAFLLIFAKSISQIHPVFIASIAIVIYAIY